MYPSHLGADPAMVPLGNPAQTLPTNPIQSLVTSLIAAVPANPASPLQVAKTQALAVVNPNSYVPPAAPARMPMVEKAGIGLGAIAAIGLVAWLILRKKH